MPYKSVAQQKYFHAKLPELAKEWDKETNFSDLVDKVHKGMKKKNGK